MRHVAFLVLVAATVVAQPQAGHGIAILVHHPEPDEADPFGFIWPDGSGSDAFATRHGRFAPEGFAYPTTVFDGIVPIVGPVEGNDPQRATDEAYAARVAQRAALPAPAVMEVAAADVDGTVRVRVWVTPVQALPDESLHLWIALAEDPVHYRPPVGLTNGVFDHPFTLRALADVGALDMTGPTETDHAFQRGDWDPEHLYVVAWLEQAALGRFEAHEVVQSIMAPLGSGITRQAEKGVLVEMLSATWCAPCLFGDRAVETLAQAHGVPVDRPAPQEGYLVLPPAWPWAALAALGAGLVLAATPRRRP